MKISMNLVGTHGEIYISGDITSYRWDEDSVSASSFRESLKELRNALTIDLHINSGGGDMFEGNAIATMIKNHPADVTAHIGLAASMASVVAMAADKRIIAENGFVMIHQPSGGGYGRASDLRRRADLMDQLQAGAVSEYERVTGLPRDKIDSMLEAETWLNAEDAVELGFADEVDAQVDIAASITDSKLFEDYRNVPELLMSVPPAGPEGQAPVNQKPKSKEKKQMDLKELQAEHPELVAEITSAASKAASESADAQVAEERGRISAIRANALPGNDELVNKAIDEGTSLVDFLVSQTASVQAKLQDKASEMQNGNGEAAEMHSGDEPADVEDEPASDPFKRKAPVNALENFKTL